MPKTYWPTKKSRKFTPITSLNKNDLENRVRLLKQYAAEDTEIIMWAVDEGPITIESRYEEELAAVPLLKLVRAARAG